MQETIHEVTKHEFFRNPPPERTSVELLSESQRPAEGGGTLHELQVRLVNQDHSLGNLLVDALLVRPGVTHAAYTRRHPQDHSVDLSVTARHDAYAELAGAIRTCAEQLDAFLAQTLGAPKTVA